MLSNWMWYKWILLFFLHLCPSISQNYVTALEADNINEIQVLGMLGYVAG